MKQPMSPARIAIYYRVSTDRQDLESQIVAIEKWVSELPVPPKLILNYRDEGFSGKHEHNRPAFQEMMQQANLGTFDTIVVYRLDRFSRDASSAIRKILELDQHGVAFISVTQPVLNLGHANPFRRTMLSAFAEIAEIERETIVARVKDGIEAARKRGVKLGPPTKITDQVRANVFALRAAGKTYREISKEIGLSTGTISAVANE